MAKGGGSTGGVVGVVLQGKQAEVEVRGNGDGYKGRGRGGITIHR